MHSWQQRMGLSVLYLLLVSVAIALHQLKEHSVIAMIVILLVIMAIIVLWKFLLRKKIITITWSSMTDAPTPYRSERIFLFSLVLLLAPVLRLHELTRWDIVWSIVIVTVALVGFLQNEFREERREIK